MSAISQNEALAPQIRAEQTRLHGKALRILPVAASTVAAAMLFTLWPMPSATALWLWASGLALAISAHMGLNWMQRAAQARAPEDPRWRRHHRAAIGMHGLVWASLVLLMGQVPEGPAHDAMAFASVAMVAGWVTTGSFDRVATALFAVPASLPALWHLLGLSVRLNPVSAIGLTLFAGMMVLSVLRGHRSFEVSVQRRLERERASGQARLLEQLLQNTEQGIWFLDNQGLTTDLNPAMCHLLGHDRADVLGRSVFDFFGGEDLAILHRQLELRKKGHKAGYEVGIVRPDGSRIACFNNATPIYDAQGDKMGSVGMWTNLTPLKEALAEAQQTRQELFALLDAFPGFVVSIDQDWRYVFINRRMAQWYGKSPKEIIGTSASTMVAAERWEQIKAWKPRVDAGEILVEEREFKAARSGGGSFWMESTRVAGLVRPDGSRLYYSFGIDITDRKRREADREAHNAKVQALLQAFPGCIASTDGEGRLLYVNDAMAQLMGSPTEALIGQRVTDLSTDRAFQRLGDLQRMRNGEILVDEVQAEARDGRPERYLQLTRMASPLDEQGQHTYYAFGIDITALKRVEQRLVAARDDADRANRAKSQFMSQMSHELRTPLNAILGFGQLLQTDQKLPLAPTQQLQVQEILHGAEHLLNLVNGLLDISRIESGKFAVQLGPVSLVSLLGEALSMMQPMATQQGIQLPTASDAPGDLYVQADRTRLLQVLLNLLSNAIKYNRERGSVSVEWLAEDAEVTIGVRDTGVGLTSEQRAQLFEPFRRLHAHAGHIEGTGIGLALSRRLVEAMGGQMGVDSEPGMGCLFWVRMPQAVHAVADDRPAPHAAAGPRAPGEPGEGSDGPGAATVRTVLYIEDNPVNLLVMQAMIARIAGLEMISADDGEPGLALALERVPDLILTDIQMPGMDGFELLRRLQQEPSVRHIPVVAISADALPESVDRGLEAGFAAYLTKPVQMEALHEAVQQHLPASGARAATA